MQIGTTDHQGFSFWGKKMNQYTAYEIVNSGHKRRFFKTYNYDKMKGLLGNLINRIQTTGENA